MRFRTFTTRARQFAYRPPLITTNVPKRPDSALNLPIHSDIVNHDSTSVQTPESAQATEPEPSWASISTKHIIEGLGSDMKDDDLVQDEDDFVWSGKSYGSLKRSRPPPYITLYDAISKASPEVAQQYRPPTPLLDLSFKNPDAHASGMQSRAGPADNSLWRKKTLDQLPTLWSITAKVIAASSPTDSLHRHEERAKSSISPDNDSISDAEESAIPTARTNLNPNELAYLGKTSFSLESIEEWVSIILERDMDKAVAKLEQLMFPSLANKTLSETDYMPLMVVMLLLKRQSISGHALQRMLNYTWHILRSAPNWVTFEDRQIYILFNRLVRHATKVLPSILPNVTAILTTFTPKVRDFTTSPDFLQRIRLAGLYNSALVALAYASGENPFRAWPFQAKSQFMLVSHMVRHDPPLDISSKGFAALIKAQLKHQKTSQEEQWAQLQSRAWPPYPKPKTAMDEDKGFEFAASRAMKTIQYMRQAGYHFPYWEDVAGIYAGWNSDGTPTIQTRDAYLPTAFDGNQEMWELKAVAARIRTTRDIREAWAQFLEYEESQLPFSSAVYWHMFTKIAQETLRVQGKQSPNKHGTSPGDMKEIIEPATSPMQKVFLTSEPPTFMELFERMTQRKFVISSSFLGALVGMSPSIDDAITIWDASTGDSEAHSLISRMAIKSSRKPGMLEEWRTFRGFTRLLCRFPWDQSAFKLFNDWERDQMRRVIGDVFQGPKGWWIQKGCSMALFQALYLVRLVRPPIQSVYTQLLEGLIQAQYDAHIPNRPPTFWFFPMILEILSLVKQSAMTPEASLFEHLCHFMELSGRSARKVLSMTAEERISQQLQYLHDSAASFMAVGPTVLRRSFAALYKPALEPSQLEAATQGLDDVPPIPHTLHAPTPMIVQRYIRALAMFQDYEGIYSLVRWCSAHEPALLETIGLLPRGMEQWELALTALRLALEQPESMFWNLPVGQQRRRAPPELVLLVRQTLEGMHRLGRWADDSEVEDYRLHIKLNAAMRSHDWTMRNTG